MMTTKQAINLMKLWRASVEMNGADGEHLDAFDMAIEALGCEKVAESCDDAISRQSVIDKLKREEKIFYSPAGLKYLIGAVRDLPSAQPEREKSNWTPVSKTIEIPEHEIIACNKYDHQMMGYLFYSCGQWICEGAVEIMYDVVAWAEKLEPYKGDEHENN